MPGPFGNRQAASLPSEFEHASDETRIFKSEGRSIIDSPLLAKTQAGVGDPCR